MNSCTYASPWSSMFGGGWMVQWFHGSGSGDRPTEMLPTICNSERVKWEVWVGTEYMSRRFRKLIVWEQMNSAALGMIQFNNHWIFFFFFFLSALYVGLGTIELKLPWKYNSVSLSWKKLTRFTPIHFSSLKKKKEERRIWPIPIGWF